MYTVPELFEVLLWEFGVLIQTRILIFRVLFFTVSVRASQHRLDAQIISRV